MAEDPRNFIEQTQARARLITGNELTVDELTKEFMKCSVSERVDHLLTIEGDEQTEYSSPREAAKHMAERHALKSVHERLRKVGR